MAAVAALILLFAQTHYAFPPASRELSIATDVAYGSSGGAALSMDVYKPSAGFHGPALIFFNRANGADRRQPFWDAWARAAASKGLIAIVPDLRQGSEIADFRMLLSYFDHHAGEQGIEAIAVYAASGNVSNALPAVEDPALTSIKAAVMYYGSAQITDFRLDLPLFYVRAGLDRPGVNESIASLVARAVAQNAPWTLRNYAGGHHAFEIVDDTDATRQVIDETIEFVKRATSPAYHAALRESIPESRAAGFVESGKFHEASAAYASLVAAHPDDARLRLSYGEALLGDARYAAACAEFEKLRGKGLGPRDLGLPAAEACVKSGDPETAVAWLRTIPPQFRPATIQDDPAFAALRSRPDFRALFLK